MHCWVCLKLLAFGLFWEMVEAAEDYWKFEAPAIKALLRLLLAASTA